MYSNWLWRRRFSNIYDQFGHKCDGWMVSISKLARYRKLFIRGCLPEFDKLLCGRLVGRLRLDASDYKWWEFMEYKNHK